MKKVLIAVLVIVVLIVIAVALLFTRLDSLVAKAIEENGSNVTQTSVSVSGVDLSLREGRGTIRGLTVANPEGFDARNAFSLDEITLDIDIESLRGEPIVIDEIRIKAPVVNAEITKTGASNIEKIRENVKAYSAGGEGQSSKPAKLIRIRRFVFEEGRVEVDVSELGLENRTVELPEIRLSDVGGTGGAPPDEIAKIILTAVAKQVSSEIAGSQLDRMVKDKLGSSITDKAKGLLDKIKE
jgi:uncharacterized protein involved in outer membrane biogenesis